MGRGVVGCRGAKPSGAGPSARVARPAPAGRSSGQCRVRGRRGATAPGFGPPGQVVDQNVGRQGHPAGGQRPDVQVVYLGHTGHARQGRAHRLQWQGEGNTVQQGVQGLLQQVQAGGQDQAANEQGQQRVDRGPTRGPDHQAGDDGRHRAQGVAQHMQQSAPHIEVALAPGQHPGHEQVHQEPHRGHRAHREAIDGARRVESRPAFARDDRHHRQHGKRVSQRRQGLGPAQAVAVPPGRWAGYQPGSQSGQCQRHGVCDHVARIGHQGQRAGPQACRRLHPGTISRG